MEERGGTKEEEDERLRGSLGLTSLLLGSEAEGDILNRHSLILSYVSITNHKKDHIIDGE